MIPVEIPPLRERGKDILLLARYFLNHFNQRYSVDFKLTPDQERLILAHTWRGNIRELANAVEHAVVLAVGSTLNFQLETMEDAPQTKGSQATLRERKQELEKEGILQALEQHRWNKTQTAEFLQISRRGLLYKIKEYGIR